MIISRTPLRISFFGGGTDYEEFFKEYGGAVLATTIDKYCYVSLHSGNCTVTFDLPTKSGLASSSAYTVGLLRVCNTKMSKKEIAQIATVWERDKMNGMVGSQDQYMCSMGGFQHIKFNGHGISDIPLGTELVKPLEDYLMLFDTHQYRHSSNVVAYQMKRLKQNIKNLLKIKEMVPISEKLLNNHDYVGFGKLLNEMWERKRELSKYVSTEGIDNIYQSAIKAGALGGKILGGGGGGFIIFLALPDTQSAVKKALEELTYVPFKFEERGTEIIFKD